jgi:hypothetical protein
MPFTVSDRTATALARDGEAVVVPHPDCPAGLRAISAGYLAAQLALKGYRATQDGSIVTVRLPEGA